MPSYLSNSEIKELSKGLASAVAESRSSDALKILEKLQVGVQPVEEVIRATKVGQSVAKVRSYEDKSVSQLAKDLVRTWKSKVDSQREAKKKESPTASASPATTAPSPSPAKPSLNNAPASSSAVSVNKKEPLNFDILNDKTRNACLKVIHTALEAGSEPGSVDAHVMFQRAREVEQATFKLIGKGEINNEYRQKMRSLSLNLKDKRNPTLSQGVVAGIIEADKLVLMTPEEMESDEKKAERAALQMQNLFKAKAAAAQEAETDAFQCGKCHQRKCTYFQKQTRSADEPMTTFVTCTHCLNKWKPANVRYVCLVAIVLAAIVLFSSS